MEIVQETVTDKQTFVKLKPWFLSENQKIKNTYSNVIHVTCV